MPFPGEVMDAAEAVRRSDRVTREARGVLKKMLVALGKTIAENDPSRFADTDPEFLDIDPQNHVCDDPQNPVGTCIYGAYEEDCRYCGQPSERK